MPELPEVETARRLAARHVAGKRIRRVTAAQDPIVFSGIAPRAFASILRGRRIVGVHRHGKHLWMELDRRPWPLFHFGMTGWFHVYRRAEERPRFWKAEIEMEDGTRLAMTDARRLGRIRLRHDPRREPPLALLGFDAHRELPGSVRFGELLRKRTSSIKAVLLDQTFAAGVGNWMADEVLYQARIAPHRRANRLTDGEIRLLRRRLTSVIRKAIAVSADSDRLPRAWLFHRRWGKVAGRKTARGEPLRYSTLAGRTTAWVPARQR